MADRSYFEERGLSADVAEAQAQLTPAEMTERLGKLIAESPSRRRGRFTPDFSLTKEYEELSGVDTSKMSTKEAEEHAFKLMQIKRAGTFTDEQRQAEIDNSLSIPLSEAIKLRDQYKADIERTEAEMDSFDTSNFDRKAEALSVVYKQRTKGKSGMQLAHIQAEYDKEYDALKFEEYTKPYNSLAVKRHEAIEKYKVYEHRIQLYCSLNKEAIVRQIEKARDAEINENLLALAEYMEE